MTTLFKIDESKRYVYKNLKVNKNREFFEPNTFFRNIDWSKYKIGDTVYYKKTNGIGLCNKPFIIWGFCIECKGPSKQIDNKCEGCLISEGNAAPYVIYGNCNICKNCKNIFKYNHKNDLYCKDCIIYENNDFLNQLVRYSSLYNKTKESKNEYKNKVKVFYEGFKSIGMDTLDDVIDFYNNIINFLNKHNFKNINEIDKFIIENKKPKIKDDTINYIIKRPVKVTFNNAFYNKYFNLMLKNNINQKFIKKTINNGPAKNFRKSFVLYKFRNIVNSIIENNRKEKYINNIRLFIYNMNNLLKSRKTPKVTLNKCLYEKFKKIKDDRISKNQNKIKLVFNKIILINRIKKILIKRKKTLPHFVNLKNANKIIKNIDKYKKYKSFNTIYNGNRNIINMYSNYYEEFIIDKKDDEIDFVAKLHDKNKNRFLRLIELYYLIKKDDTLYKSNIIFNYYTLAKIHKKNDNFDIFLNLLKNKLDEYKQLKKPKCVGCKKPTNRSPFACDDCLKRRQK